MKLPGEPDRAVKHESVTCDADICQAVAYGKMWTVFPLTCPLDIAKYKEVVFWGSTTTVQSKGKGCAVKVVEDQA